MELGRYRGWDIDRKKWAKGYLLKSGDGHCYIGVMPTKNRIMRVEVCPWTVCELTGQTDAEGYDIYEGDVLMTSEGMLVAVSRENGAAGYYFDCGGAVMSRCKVVGDILTGVHLSDKAYSSHKSKAGKHTQNTAERHTEPQKEK